MERKKEKNLKEGHYTRIGPLLKKAFEKQKDKIREVTYNCSNPSDYEVGEVIAKKVMGLV